MKFLLLIFIIDKLMRPLDSAKYSSRTSSRVTDDESDYSSNENPAPLVRLNKFISNAGVCARREADKLIESGRITVNGEVVKTVGIKIPKNARVMYKDTVLSTEKMRYILLNKPRGYVSTLYDPEGRRTVLDLIKIRDCPERIYPVGRLDYDTTGILLLTNDGKLARELSHPAREIEKYYHAVLDKPLLQEDMERIRRGVTLDDGIAEVDDVQALEEAPTHVGVAIHMGRNRVVRRIFNRLGYVVESLDRVGYAHLTTEEVPRRKWIFLKDRDVRKLKALVNITE